MQQIRELGRRILVLFQGKKFDTDLAEEMRLHLDLRREQLGAQGLDPLDVQRAAQRVFGNSTLLRERSSDEWGWRALEQFGQDLHYGARAMLRKPGFTAAALLVLALGTGANTAIFSVVSSVLLNPLSYNEPDRLATILHEGTKPVAPANYLDWRDQSHSFEAMGAAEYWSPNLTNSFPPEHLLGLRLTQSILPMLGTPPMIGRLFAAGEDIEGAEYETILSYGLWQRRFAGDPNILGRKMILDGKTYRVVGVMPRDFKFAPFWATRAELWTPLALGNRIHNRTGNSLRVFARLKAGVSFDEAQASITVVANRLESQYPGTNRAVIVTPLRQNVVGKVEAPLLTLLCACGFVLLIACANVGHLLMARISDRQPEIALRLALGAGRGRLVRQFLAESLLLATLGSAAGLLLALWATKALVALSPANIPRIESVFIDIRAALFLLGITALTTFIFGLLPAMHAAAGDVNETLKPGSRRCTGSVNRNRFRDVLVVSEFAIATLLMIGAGLMIRTFIKLQSDEPGFDPRGLLSMVVSVAGSNEAEPSRREVFYRQLIDRVRTAPGVISASGINHLPLAGDVWGMSFAVEGRPVPRPGESPAAVFRVVMPGYFQTMRLPVVRGRPIMSGDDTRTSGVLLINEQAARRYWPGEDPIGKRVTFDSRSAILRRWLTVIGIAKDAKQSDWAALPDPEVYLAALQNSDFLGSPASHISYLTLVVRAAQDPAAIAPAIKKIVWSFDQNLPISDVFTMDRVVANANAQPRFEMTLLSVFAVIALLLAAVGIYGVMSYSVARRTNEIGIRLALGADGTGVIRMLLRQGLVLAVSGVGAGIACSVFLSRFIANMLYGVQPQDPITFLVVPGVLGFTALLAVFLPSRKAARIEPVIALRHE